jgi:hypothetical protein
MASPSDARKSWLCVCLVSVTSVSFTGCGRSVSDRETAGYGSTGESGAGVGESDGGSGGSAGGGGFGGDACQAIQDQAQRAADTSCTEDSDCGRPPHVALDCTECGVVTNLAAQDSSIAAARAICVPFYQRGCQLQLHSCPAYQPMCVAGVCAGR